MLFHACRGLVDAKNLIIRIDGGASEEFSEYFGCDVMFFNCPNLVTAPRILPSETLVTRAYFGMFQGCTSLTSAPVLPATALTEGCYENMFAGCTSLATAPALPATELTASCYSQMFKGCTSLTSAPDLDAPYLEYECYAGMFSGCTHLRYIRCLAEGSIDTTNTNKWVANVAASGTFVRAQDSEWPPEDDWRPGYSTIPYRWGEIVLGISFSKNNVSLDLTGGTDTITVSSSSQWTATTADNWISLSTTSGNSGNTSITISASSTQASRGGSITFTCPDDTKTLSVSQVDWAAEPFTITVTSVEPGESAYINLDTNTRFYGDGTSDLSDSLEYRINNGEWAHPVDTEYGYFIPVEEGDVVQFRGVGRDVKSQDSGEQKQFLSFDYCECELSGRLMSLLDKNDPQYEMDVYQFMNFFNYCTGITSVENLVFPTGVTIACYYEMFYECTGLTTGPELPAATLADGCYNGMFKYCSSLNYIKCLATNISANNCTSQWLYDVASSGTFVKNASMSGWGSGSNGIPSNWTIQNA